MSKTLFFSILLLGLVAAPSAFARSVFLNGVNISTLRGKTFKNATISIDANGDIHIDAPKYKVKVVDDAVAAASTKTKVDNGGPNPTLTQKYYLVTTPSTQGRAQFDFVVTINGRQKKVIKAGSSQMILEISAWLNKGSNTIAVTAKKQLGDGRKSFSASDRAKILIGKGHEEGSRVKIDTVYLSLGVDASQTADATKHYTLEAR